MSDFLKNLLDRHKLPSTRAQTPVVEPRPKSRFESIAVSAVEPTETEGDDMSSSSVSKGVSESRNDAQQQNRVPTPVQVDIEQPTPGAESHEEEPADRKTSAINPNEVDDLTARIEALSLQLGDKLSFTQPKTDGQLNNKYIQSESPQGSVNKETLVDSDDFSMGYALEQRVESVIKRLANQNKGSRPEQVNKPQNDSVATESKPDLKQQSPTKQVTPIESEPSSKLGLLNNETQAKQPVATETGMLQQPAWLNEMQSDLNKRWQHINAKPESTKSVVNVTIGRLEVRAVQNSGGQAPKVQKKSRGVMSLDDYLKSRGKEGRA